MFSHRLPEVHQAAGLGIVGLALFEGLDRLVHNGLGSVEVRLAHLQVNDIPALSLQLGGLFHYIHDDEGRDLPGPFANPHVSTFGCTF